MEHRSREDIRGETLAAKTAPGRDIVLRRVDINRADNPTHRREPPVAIRGMGISIPVTGDMTPNETRMDMKNIPRRVNRQENMRTISRTDIVEKFVRIFSGKIVYHLWIHNG